MSSLIGSFFDIKQTTLVSVDAERKILRRQKMSSHDISLTFTDYVEK